MANKNRLINLDFAISKIKDEGLLGSGYSNDERIYDVCDMLESCPAVDAMEVVHGRWVFGELDVLGQPVHCSVCGWGSDMVNRAMWLLYDGHKFCGHCGAKMDGGNEDG